MHSRKEKEAVDSLQIGECAWRLTWITAVVRETRLSYSAGDRPYPKEKRSKRKAVQRKGKEEAPQSSAPRITEPRTGHTDA